MKKENQKMTAKNPRKGQVTSLRTRENAGYRYMYIFSTCSEILATNETLHSVCGRRENVVLGTFVSNFCWTVASLTHQFWMKSAMWVINKYSVTVY